jgi:hypothetical protein
MGRACGFLFTSEIKPSIIFDKGTEELLKGDEL